MTVRRGALCAASGAALLLLVALAGCRLAHKEAQWSAAVLGWSQLAEARAAAWWAAHSPAAVAARPPQPPAALCAALGPSSLPRQLAQPLSVVLQLPDQRQLQLREDATLESLVARLLQEQAGLHPTAIELISVEEVTQQRTSPFRAVLRAVAALREPSAGHTTASSAGGEGTSGDVAALTADPALQQLAAGGSVAPRLRSDVGSADGGKHALQAVQLSSKGDRHALQSGRKLRQQALHLASQQPEHPLLKLFGPARSFDSPAEPASELPQAGAAEGEPLIIVELTLVGQEGGRHPYLWSLLDGLSSRLGSTGVTSGSGRSSPWHPAAEAAEPAEVAAGEAADGSRWSVAAHLANAEEYLQSLLPPHQPAQASWHPSHLRQRHSHTHGHVHSHQHLSWVQQGVALPTRPPPSPLKLAALDTVFVAATLVALVCTALLVADIWRHGLWSAQHSQAGNSCRGCPAGALVAVGQPEQHPLLVVVAADEVVAAQQAGYSPL